MIRRHMLVRRPVRPGYWFAPKRYGWGAGPANWQGWAATAVFAAAMAVVGLLAEAVTPLLAWMALPLIVAFVTIVIQKTDGEWRWRWGEKDE